MIVWIAVAVYVVFALVFAVGLGRAAKLGDRLGEEHLGERSDALPWKEVPLDTGEPQIGGTRPGPGTGHTPSVDIRRPW